MRKLLIGSGMFLIASLMGAQEFSVNFTSKTPFVVGEASLPAGTYHIRLMDDNENTFECSTISGSPSVMFEADTHEVIPTVTAVTFAKYGDKLILKNISIAGVQGYWLPISLQEKHSKKAGVKGSPVAMTASKP
jgi:hypothetical protein